ncbi:MAG: class I SAM-dependent methyltransferase [Anaerolinea sp.]|nr:class I SAM-dependent methyltransferase [Anaerolinea sp.]
MNVIAAILIAVIVVAALVALGWWLFIETEGVYLGRRVVIWLYDLYAARYDRIKKFQRHYDHMFLAQPLMERIAPNESPRVLDVATGTGRLPLALIRHKRFRGQVIGLDLSRRMLDHAADKLADRRVQWVCAPAESLPFPTGTFDVVTCLEAIEFMTRRETALREMIRVLRPGGILLATNRIHARWMVGKTYKDDDLAALLQRLGMGQVEIESWQVDYDLVWGYKKQTTAPPAD